MCHSTKSNFVQRVWDYKRRILSSRISLKTALKVAPFLLLFSQIIEGYSLDEATQNVFLYDVDIPDLTGNFSCQNLSSPIVLETADHESHDHQRTKRVVRARNASTSGELHKNNMGSISDSSFEPFLNRRGLGSEGEVENKSSHPHCGSSDATEEPKRNSIKSHCANNLHGSHNQNPVGRKQISKRQENKDEASHEHSDEHPHEHVHGGTPHFHGCGLQGFHGHIKPWLGVSGVLVIMLASASSIALVLFINKINGIVLEHWLFFLRHLGAGVILATAFSHMIMPASEVLSNGCGIKFFSTYEGLASVFAMFGILFSHGMNVIMIAMNSPSEPKCTDSVPSSAYCRGMSSGSGHTTTFDTTLESLNNLPSQENYLKNNLSTRNTQKFSFPAGVDLCAAHNHSCVADCSLNYGRVTFICLESTIAVHSLLMGLSTGLSGQYFSKILPAFAFHQFFEGVALASCYMSLKNRSRGLSIGMILLYSLITPIGMAVGLGVQEFSDVIHSPAGRVSTAILEDISGGFLLYECLANILSVSSTADAVRANKGKVFPRMVCLWIGAAIFVAMAQWI